MRVPNFSFSIAEHARIGRATGFVFLGEIMDNLLLEVVRLINQIIRDVELLQPRRGRL